MNKQAIISIIIFLLVIAGMFGYASYKKQQMAPAEEVVPEEVVETTPYDHITRVDAKHFFIDGTHTLVGEITMPTPCDLLTHEEMIAESFPEQVSINFDVINNAEFCAEMETAQRFIVSVDVSEEASFRAFLKGRELELNLIPAAEGETPDEFELFIKG